METITSNNTASENSVREDLWSIQPKILLVEDTDIIQIVNSTMLRTLGCHVGLAKTGVEALVLSKQNYDLIFLDLGLPDISGITIAKAIRNEEAENNRTCNILIALTTSNGSVIEECINAGMNDFHTKPITIEKLQQVLIEWLPNHCNSINKEITKDEN